MAKNIVLSNEDIAELSTRRFFEGKFEIRRDTRRVTVAFTPIAWIKMYSLVDAFDKEVQWHGLVTRMDENTFLIEDILIFPHVATSTTVVSEQEEYEQWLDELPDDKFNACRFHGHSHVRMAVTPSVVDMTYRKNIFENFSRNPMDGEDQFYIFIIVNKDRKFNGQVYDITGNALYETDEIDIEVLDNGDYLSDFVKEARTIVKNPPVTQPKTEGKISSPNGTSVQNIQPAGQTTYPRQPHLSESDEEWARRVYGGGKHDSADPQYRGSYPKSGFNGGAYN